MAFVPLPLPPPPLPVMKNPSVVPSKKSPAGFCPSTLQTMNVFGGNAGEGVHVRTVLPTVHAAEIGNGVKGALGLIKVANVTPGSGSIGSLKMKTTAADGETPLAGGGDTTVGWACACCRLANNPGKTSSRA